MVTMRQASQSASLNWLFVEPQPGRPPNMKSAAATKACWPMRMSGSAHLGCIPL